MTNANDKPVSVPAYRVAFLRIDTTARKPYLEGPSASEMVIMALLAGREKEWFDLVDFTVLPNEVQIMFVPRSIIPQALVEHLEAEVHPFLSILKPITGKIFDPEFYQERFECLEEIKQRQRWMAAAPVRAGVSQPGSIYMFSSANPRYQELVVPLNVIR